jgi:uncharacterized protein (DUF427 family)
MSSFFSQETGMNPGKNTQGPERESVWDYPRPPRIEDFERPIQVVFAGTTIADTHRAKRVLETSHPPCYYIPPSDVLMDHLIPTSRSTWCEWKGKATYYSVRVGGRIAENAAWAYLKPNPAFEPIQGWVTFYASLMDACFVDGEKVRAQAGDFYGGWITENIVGPFKGGPGTRGW